MKISFRRFVWLPVLLLLLTGCATTSIKGRKNEEYQTEKPVVAAEKTEAPDSQIVYLTPKKDEIPPYYFKVRVPGIKSVLFVYSDETGDTQFRVFGRLSNETERGFFPAEVSSTRTGMQYSMKVDDRKLLDLKDDKPGTPRRNEKPAPDREVQPHWMKVRERTNLYHIRDKNGTYQFRQWAKLGEKEGFYPSNDGGILIRGGIPDAVKIGGKWVAVRIMNPMTFAYTDPDLDETEEVIISYPEQEETEPVRTPEETEPPRTEPPATEPPATEPPATEPPATEPPETEPPVTEPPVTEPPVTEPPITEPPVTEPPEETP